MLKFLNHNNMGSSLKNDINSIFHFSIADYDNPEKIHYGKLRVLNDEIIKPGAGHDLHSHRNLEVLTYIIDGEMNYFDSINNADVFKKGDFIHLSSGIGVFHSELNKSDRELRLIQAWILPNKRSLTPSYNKINIGALLEANKIIKVGGLDDAPISINQEVNVSILKINNEEEINFDVGMNRQAYLVQIEGSSLITTMNEIDGEINLKTKDALEIVEEEITIRTKDYAHIIIIEMKRW